MAREDYGAFLAVPRNTDSPSLLIALGRKSSLRLYTYPDIRQLIDLAELMDNILAHATLSRHMVKLGQMESAMMISRSLAHDLSNLTTPIASYLLHTEGRAPPGSAEAEVHQAASQSIKVMNDYIRESLFYSRKLSPNLQSTDPREALAVVAKLAQERANQRGISLQFQCEISGQFKADTVLFQRLAINLVNNAIDASDAVTSVKTLLSEEPAGVVLTVTNHGPDIPSENLKRIFDPYFTTKNTGSVIRGLGLGLAISRKIVELHGGQIEVRSRGNCTVFTASFPQSAVQNGQAAASASGTMSGLVPPGPLCHVWHKAT